MRTTPVSISGLAEQRKQEVPASSIPKLVRDTPGGPAKIAAAQTMLMIWALERGLPWSTPCLD